MREELQSLQGQVIRQERLAAVGQLVSGVAHEINNPLQAILGFAELLQMQAQRARRRQGRSDPDSEGKRARVRHHPQPGAVRAAAARRGRAGALGDVITSVAELRQRRLESEDIELRIEDQSEAARAGRADRAAAGRAQLRRQRRAGDPGVRPPARPHHDPDARRGRPRGARGRGHRPRRSARERGQAVPAVLHHQAGRARAPASASRSATASSTRWAATSATAARPPAARSSTSICPPRPNSR